MIKLKTVGAFVICTFLTPTFGSAIGISAGDILIHGCLLETGESLYLLEKRHDYEAVKLPTRSGWFVYEIDRARKRLYYHDGGYNYSYFGLSGETLVEKEVRFLPEGMKISSCAADGSCLILYKAVYDDIYAEENPIYVDTPRFYGTNLLMLYRYDMRTKGVTRLTYSYAQEDSWVTPDGECLAYLRYYEGWRGDDWFDTTVVFCRIDGTAKYDLRFFFKDAGVDMAKIKPGFSFAPKVGYELNGEKYYYAVFRPERRRGDEVEGPGTLDYYYAKLKYEGFELRCEVTERFIEIPEGVRFCNFFSEPSSERELYFFGSVKGEGGGIGIIRYDVYDDSFYAIPNTGVFLSFLVY